jgi:general secretion pathway protein A
MYLDFYHLRKEPFQNVPDPEFLFLSPSHREALASIIYGIEQRKGFITITGEVGVGKTSILRYYLEQVPKANLKTIYIFNPNLTFVALLKTILQKQGIQAKSDDSYELLNQFHQVLIDRFRSGTNVVLIIDEAQNMPVETLENLRMLSNLETSKAKLLQIVLVGQPELDEKLGRNELRQLRQRIAVKTTIRPLTREECADYVQHRIAKASLNGASLFTPSAVRRIITASGGVPRLMNVLCDNALITGFGYQRSPIDAPVVQEVIDDFKGKKSVPFLLSSRVGFTIAIALLYLALAVLCYTAGRKFLFSGMAGAGQPPAVQEMQHRAGDPGVARPVAGVMPTPHGEVPVGEAVKIDRN